MPLFITKMNPKVAILIPCFNEEKTIGVVIDDFKKALPNSRVYVCNNNSTDNTYDVAKTHGATVINEYKKGKSNAVLTLLKKVDADIYIMVDGDDTYPAENAPQMIETLLKYNVDMVVGDRLSSGAYKKENKRAFHNFGNILIRKLINYFFKANLKDILSGYRVFTKGFIKNYTNLIKGFELEVDLTLFSLNYNLSIKEEPIEYRDRPAGSVSKLNTYKDGIKIICLFINLYRLYKPLSFFRNVSVLFFLIAIVFSINPVYEYFNMGYVYKVPSLIVSVMFFVASTLSLLCGFILDSILKIDRKNIKLNIRNTK